MTSKELYMYAKLNREFAFNNKNNRAALAQAKSQKRKAKKLERHEGKRAAREGMGKLHIISRWEFATSPSRNFSASNNFP